MARQCLANRSTLGESERTLNCLMVYLNLPPGVTTKQMKLKLQTINREAEVLPEDADSPATELLYSPAE